MRVRTFGIKARDLDVELGRFTLLSAECGSGKSTVAEALRFAFLGFIPQLGETSKATAALMRGREMVAEVTLDDGRTVKRSLTATNKGLVSKVVCSWLPDGATQKDHHAAAVEMVGSDETTAAECLDIRELLNATPNKRTARIEKLLSSGNMTADERVALVSEMTVRRLTDSEAREVADWRVLLSLVPGTAAEGGEHRKERAALVAAGPMLLAKLREGSIRDACEWANIEKRERNADAIKKGQARKELEARLEGMTVPTDEEVAATEGERSAAERQLGAIRERNMAVAKSIVAKAEAQKNLEASVARHGALLTKRASAANIVAEREEIQRRFIEATAKLAEVEAFAPVPGDTSASDELMRQAAELRKQIDLGQGDLFAPSKASHIAIAKKHLAGLESQLRGVTCSPWFDVLNLAMQGRVECAADSKAFELFGSIIAISEDNGANDTKAVKQEINDTKANIAKLEAEAVAEAEAKAVRECKNNELKAQADALTKQAQQAREKVAADYQVAVNAHANERKVAQATVATLKATLAELSKQDCPTDADIAKAEAEVDAAQARVNEMGEVAALEATDEIESTISTLAAKLNEYQSRKATARELAALIADLESAEAARNVYAAIEWGCQRAAEREVTAAGGALTGIMATFLTAAGRAEVPFFRAEKERCDIGWNIDGRDVLIQTLCGGEWVMFAAALAAAVININAPEMPLLLVEGGETDETFIAGIMRGIEAVNVPALVMVQRDVDCSTAWQKRDPRECALQKAA